jgi:DNA excision repair protein ERCC-3
MTDGPLIVQSDKTLLLEVDHPGAGGARRGIAPFAELERAPEHIHTYRVTPLGLWNAARPGTTPSRSSTRSCAQPVCRAAATPRRHRRDDVALWPADPREGPGPRPGAARTDRPVLEEVLRHKKISRCSANGSTPTRSWSTPPSAAISSSNCSRSVGPQRTWPAMSTARPTRLRLREEGWTMRPYQRQAVEGFWHGGSGVVVLPCGAGKTIVGAGAMARPSATTLILVTNTVAPGSGRTSCCGEPR